MKKLALIILLLGCAAPDGIYEVHQAQRMVGVAISTESLISVIHPPYVGQKVYVKIRHKWKPAKVTRLGPAGIVELVGVDEPLDLQPGDSGSPVAIIIGSYEQKRYDEENGEEYRSGDWKED